MTDDAKIISIGTRAPWVPTGDEPQAVQPEPKPVNDNLIKVLETLLNQAHAGDINGLTCVSFYNESPIVDIVMVPVPNEDEDQQFWLARAIGWNTALTQRLATLTLDEDDFETIEDGE